MANKYQYTDYTSESAKVIGRVIKYSPAKIDNYIEGYFATLGRLALSAADETGRLAGVFPERKLPITESDIPLVRGFIGREPIGSASQSVNDFYDNYSKLQTVKTTLRRLKEEKRHEEAITFIKENRDALGSSDYRKAMKIAYKQIKQIRERRDLIMRTEMSPEARKRILDNLNEQMTRIARTANSIK
jgi:hypothetical protein